MVGASSVFRWVRTTFVALGGLVVVVLPWFAYSVFRVDPLAAPRGSRSAWIPRGIGSDRSGSPFRREPAVVGLPRRHRWRRALAVPLVVVALLGSAVWLRSTVAPSSEQLPAAVADVAWWPEYRRTTKWVLDRGFDPTARPRMQDVSGPLVNVDNGVRATWRPPACDCPTLRVWMYGGSTTFGMGQRDNHTIASELARRAWRDGVALLVENRGVPGDVHWVEAQSFAWDVSAGPVPDVVIFYDGANDAGAAARGISDSQPVDPPMEDTGRMISRFSSPFDWLAGPAPDGVDLQPTTTLGGRSPEEVGAAVATTYLRAREVSLRAADAHGVVPLWLWQPTTATKRVHPDEPQDPSREWSAVVHRSALERIHGSVVDLTGVLDDVDEPVFFDSVHTNEVGARAVAEAIYQRFGAEWKERARVDPTGSPGG